jgi:hypothetical protein|nr:MAG TPA: hypothetical protein [Bacteriophage sp.]
MNEEKILTFALREALNVWSKCKDRADSIPDNKIAAYKEQKAWNDVLFLKKMLISITAEK